MGRLVGINDFSKTKVATIRTEELENELDRRKFNKPFPLDIFHDKAKPFIEALHFHYDIPSAFIGLSLLSAYSTSIGTGYHVRINKLGDIYFPVWACLEGVSSSGKSLIMNQIFKPLFGIQREMEERWFNEVESMEREQRANHPIKQIIYGEANIPTLIKTIMPYNPKGILQDADEILSWVNGMNQLSSRGRDGTDEQFWMKCWNCRPHRKLLSGNQYFVIPRPFLNVIGGAQPSVMWKLFKNDRDTTGFIFRLLFAVPDRVKIAEPDYLYDMPEEYEAMHRKCLGSLYKGIRVDSAEDDSASLIIDPKALKLFMEWSNAKVRKINSMEDDWQIEIHAGIIGKIKEYVIRFCGLLHLADKGYEGKPFIGSGDLINSDTMERAIKAADYFYDAAADISDRVNKKMIATPEVLRWVTYHNMNMTNQEIGDLEYPNKSKEARRKHAARTKKKLIQEYAKLFRAQNV